MSGSLDEEEARPDPEEAQGRERHNLSVRTTKKEKEGYGDKNIQYLEEIKEARKKEAEEAERLLRKQELAKEKLRKRALEDLARAKERRGESLPRFD
jgi:hypothetical protein